MGLFQSTKFNHWGFSIYTGKFLNSIGACPIVGITLNVKKNKVEQKMTILNINNNMILKTQFNKAKIVGWENVKGSLKYYKII